MTTTERLLADIERFLARSGMAPTTFGRRACGDANLLARLQGGATVRATTMDRIYAFMSANRTAKRARGPFGARAA